MNRQIPQPGPHSGSHQQRPDGSNPDETASEGKSQESRAPEPQEIAGSDVEVDRSSWRPTRFDQGTKIPTTTKASGRCLVVHRVECSRSSDAVSDHSEHPRAAFYADEPRLFEQDSRGSVLRGRLLFLSLHEYREDHPEITMMVVRLYNCERYHENIHDSFELVADGVERHVPTRLRPWLYRLPHDGPTAIPLSERLEISRQLSSCLARLGSTPQSVLGEWVPDVALREPYDYFFHFRRALQNESTAIAGTIGHPELQTLNDFIDEEKGPHFDRIEAIFESGFVSKEAFSKLFRPRSTIVTFEDGEYRAYRVEDMFMSDNEIEDDETSSVDLDCWAWEFDGSFRKVSRTINVLWPPGVKDRVFFKDLSAWPLSFGGSLIKEKLLERGKRCWSCRHRRLVSYDAPASAIFEIQVVSMVSLANPPVKQHSSLCLRPKGAQPYGSLIEFIRGNLCFVLTKQTNPKYMIDHRTHRQMHPSKYKQPMASHDEMKDFGIDMDALELSRELDYLLMPPTVLGYAFHDKKWRTLSLDYVKEIPWNTSAWDRLVLKQNKKETIEALVNVHLTTAQNVDVVDNKGNGLIILLHGSPGTGKTLTAESVAELTKKPLYRVTCGDVGTNAEEVERYMESVLLLGTIWGCVVLLDEADIFLEERQVTDLSRNALVSVFLRVLEYYTGILILTTNRVGTFDEAFKSRIQLAVHYPILDEDGRYEIWLNFIHILRERGVDMNSDELEHKARVLARPQFNGRQIRNNLWAAVQVAKHKNQRLSYSHLDQVVEITREFEQYLFETHGHSDAEYAKAARTRRE